MKFTITLLSLLFTIGNLHADIVEKTLEIVEANNIELKLAREQGVTILLEARSESGILKNTEVEYSPFFKKGFGMIESELIIKQNFETPWATIARNSNLQAQKNTQKAAYDAVRQQVLLQAKTLCLEVIGLNKRLHIVERRNAIADSMHNKIHRELEMNNATTMDHSSLHIEVIAVKRDMLETKLARQKALASLRTLAGGREIIIEDTEFPAVPEICTFEYIEDARIVASDAAVTQTKKEVKNSILMSITDMYLGFRRETALGESLNGMMVGMTIPLFNNQKRRKIASSRLAKAELTARQTRLELEQEAFSLQSELEQAEETIKATDSKFIYQQLDLMRKAVNEHAISMTEYYLMCNNLYEMLEQLIATETLYHQTLAAINRARL